MAKKSASGKTKKPYKARQGRREFFQGDHRIYNPPADSVATPGVSKARGPNDPGPDIDAGVEEIEGTRSKATLK